MKNIAIIGLGYVGLPVLLSIANKTNHKVIGFDISNKIIDNINKGISPIIDAEVNKVFSESKRLDVTSDESKLADSNIYIICVPTPVDEDYEPDYSPLISATKMVCGNLKKGDIIVVESTIKPGTCEEIVEPVVRKETQMIMGEDYDIVHTPERINPGDKKWNVTNIPRNIGGSRREAAIQIKNLYSEYIDAELNVVSTLKVAEASKIVENSFRDINIAFANELAKSFDAMDINLIETINAASNKPFGFMPFWPGPGVGGHCIAVDPYFLIRRAAKAGFNHRLLKEGREINNSMPKYTVEKLSKILNHSGKSIKNSKIAFLGLSYKANVGDLRESPALEVKNILEKMGAELNIFDPYLPEMSTVSSIEEALDKSDILMILTNHLDFLNIDSELLSANKIEVILDTKHCLNPDLKNDSRFNYAGIGI